MGTSVHFIPLHSILITRAAMAIARRISRSQRGNTIAICLFMSQVDYVIESVLAIIKESRC